jgi:hypothetical protein
MLNQDQVHQHLTMTDALVDLDDSIVITDSTCPNPWLLNSNYYGSVTTIAPLADLKAGVISGSWTGASPTWTTNTTIGATGSNYQFRDWNISQSNITQSGQVHLTGDNADIMINGQSLNATLAAIQERMGMLVPNAEMEAEWDELRELAERYRELEKHCKEKSKIWNTLKKV